MLHNGVSLIKVANGYYVELPNNSIRSNPNTMFQGIDMAAIAKEMAKTTRNEMHKDPLLEKLQGNTDEEDQNQVKFPMVVPHDTGYIFSEIDQAPAFIKLCFEN